MLHRMRLKADAFDRIQSGSKRIEVRLNDDKRKRVQIGDQILFVAMNDDDKSLHVKVLELLPAKSFSELVGDRSMTEFGLDAEHDRYDYLKSIYEIYSKDDEKLFGVLGMEIELV